MKRKVKYTVALAVLVLLVSGGIWLAQGSALANLSREDLEKAETTKTPELVLDYERDLGVTPDKEERIELDDGGYITSEEYTSKDEEEHKKVRENLEKYHTTMKEKVENGELEGVTVGGSE